MTDKLAVKKLSASDLTFFEWQYRNRNAGNQKSINLNADVFVDVFYPAIEVATRETDGRISIDLWLYGPAAKDGINLQRKIIKGDAYKNWRLNGEFIFNPLDDPERFNALQPDDFVIFAFEGDVVPSRVTAIFVARGLPKDERVHRAISQINFRGRESMKVLDETVLSELIIQAGLAEDHPIAGLSLTTDIQEAAQGSANATERILKRGRVPRISLEALRRARVAADAIGRLGEELVAGHLKREVRAGRILAYEWVSKENVLAPFDFRISQLLAPEERIDVKTTRGPFDREFHVSFPELQEMATIRGPYRIWRVYDAKSDGAKLRISADITETAKKILRAFESLPSNVTVDAVSIDPREVEFSDVVDIRPPTDDDTG